MSSWKTPDGWIGDAGLDGCPARPARFAVVGVQGRSGGLGRSLEQVLAAVPAEPLVWEPLFAGDDGCLDDVAERVLQTLATLFPADLVAVATAVPPGSAPVMRIRSEPALAPAAALAASEHLAREMRRGEGGVADVAFAGWRGVRSTTMSRRGAVSLVVLRQRGTLDREAADQVRAISSLTAAALRA